MIDINKIMTLLPHRYPFLLIDRIISIEEDFAIGLKNVTINEPFFSGHFPVKPIMPGVLILEAMAQTCGVMMISNLDWNEEDLKTKLLYFASMDNVKFRAPVVPGDQLILEVKIIKKRSNFFKAECSAKVKDAVVTSAVIGATFVDNA